jgi:hypothetical protein
MGLKRPPGGRRRWWCIEKRVKVRRGKSGREVVMEAREFLGQLM